MHVREQFVHRRRLRDSLRGYRLIVFVATAFLAVTSTAFAADGAKQTGEKKFFPYSVQEMTLPNGLKTIVVNAPSPGLITYFSVVRTGSRDEVEPGKSGFAHFFEHMMFRGTKTYPGPEYDRIVTNLGAHSNAFTSDDVTAYHMTFAKDDLEKVVEIESDRFQNLSYEKPAFQTEAGAVYGEYRKGISNPFMLLEEKVADCAFDKHTYKHTTMGFEADIKAMPQAYDYSLSFFKRFYRPENVVILVVGDANAEKTFALIKKYYGAWKPGYETPKITPEPEQKAERQLEVKYPGKTLPILCLAYKGAAFDPTNRLYAASLLLDELAFGSTSELQKKLVLRDQKAEFLASDVPMHRDMPLFFIYSMVKDEKDVDGVKGEIDATIAKFQKELVSPELLEKAKRGKRYGFLMGLDSAEKTANALVGFVAMTGDVKAVDQLYESIQQVTPEDVREAAKTYYQPTRRTVTVLKGVQ